MPKRPEGLPSTATWNAKKKLWEDRSDPKVERVWAALGLALEAGRDGDNLHGKVSWTHIYHENDDEENPSLALHDQLELPTGPASYGALEAVYDHGELRSAAFFRLYSGRELSASAEWQRGTLHGKVMWSLELTGDKEPPIIKYGKAETMMMDFKIPKPWPARVEAIFENGKMKSATYFDKNGKPRGAPAKPAANWGQDLKTVDGYVPSSFAKDVAALFGTKPPCKVKPERPAKTWIKSLPKPHHASATAFAKIVESGKFPFLGIAFDVNSYGFDCRANELAGANDERYVGLSADGSGNLHLLDLKTGKVHGYEVEGDELDRKRVYDSIDAYAYALLRIEAVANKLIKRTDLAKTFTRLGIAAGKKDLELVNAE